jgi:D-alanine-D-alanine ligase
VVDSVEVRAATWAANREGTLGQLEAFAGAANPPDERLMIKPARLGSSIGMTLAHDGAERAGALDLAFRYDDLAVVERYLARARDLEISVIGSEPPLGVYGPGEIVAGHEFYDYAAKYLDADGADLRIPADLAPAVAERIQRMAVSAFGAIDAAGMARVDFFVEGDGSGEGAVWLNEINTIPGFTSISMYPKLWQASGLPYAQLIERLLDLAVERHEAERGRAISARELSS